MLKQEEMARQELTKYQDKAGQAPVFILSRYRSDVTGESYQVGLSYHTSP